MKTVKYNSVFSSFSWLTHDQLWPTEQEPELLTHDNYSQYSAPVTKKSLTMLSTSKGKPSDECDKDCK